MCLLCGLQCELSVSALPSAAAARVMSSLLGTLPDPVSRYYMRRSAWKDEFVRQQLLRDDEAHATDAMSQTS